MSEWVNDRIHSVYELPFVQSPSEVIKVRGNMQGQNTIIITILMWSSIIHCIECPTSNG